MSIIKTPIDFSSTPLGRNYSPFFALILDNVFSADECASLITLAESSGPWEPAAGDATYISGFRHSSRILRDDVDTASLIHDRIRGCLEEAGVTEIGPESKWVEVTGKKLQNWSKARGETGFWKVARLNPMLRFLKYGEGEYFKPHCDGLYENKENQTKSFLTVHLYLNDGNGLEGGATRFWTPDKKEWLDVEPKMGRILVFQQRMLVHSGERVTGGIKVTMRTDVMFERVVVTREERKARVAEEQGAMQDA